MVEFTIEPYYEHILVAILGRVEGSKVSSWVYDRLMAFPGTKYNKLDQTWVVAKCYQHLVEIVLLTYLNRVSRKEWLAKYRADTGTKELSLQEARSLIKEHHEPLGEVEWTDYLLLTLPEGSSWRRILEKKFRLENGIY